MIRGDKPNTTLEKWECTVAYQLQKEIIKWRDRCVANRSGIKIVIYELAFHLKTTSIQRARIRETVISFRRQWPQLVIWRRIKKCVDTFIHRRRVGGTRQQKNN